MKHLTMLFLVVVSLGHALELEFGDWKKFIDEDKDGYRKTAYQGNQDAGEFQITYVAHVNGRRDDFSYLQGITIGLKGKDTVVADLSVSYDKNGQYLKHFDVLKAEWIIRYGRFPGPGVYKEEECILVTEPTDGPKQGRRLVFIRKNGLFTVYSPVGAGDPKF